MKKARVLIVLAGALACWGFGGLLWLSVSDGDPGSVLWIAPCLAAALVSTFGLWQRKQWALVLSRCVAVATFGVGCYLANFAWTFWIFQTPTLMDRILAVLRPQISLFIVLPVLWGVMSFRPDMTEQFRDWQKNNDL